MALIGMTRPEGPMLFLIYLALYSYRVYKDDKLQYQQAIKYTLSFSLIYGPYFLWRLIYFGQLFPNPVYCKALNAPSGAFQLDISYLFLIIPLLLSALPYFIRKSNQSCSRVIYLYTVFLLSPSKRHKQSVSTKSLISSITLKHVAV